MFCLIEWDFEITLIVIFAAIPTSMRLLRVRLWRVLLLRHHGCREAVVGRTMILCLTEVAAALAVDQMLAMVKAARRRHRHGR
jgi:hypothetical protein